MKNSAKKIVTILECFLITFTLFFTTGVFAFGEVKNQNAVVDFDSLDFMEASGVKTEITDIYGDTQTFDGMLESESLDNSTCVEKIYTYDILRNGDVLVSIEVHDMGTESDEDTHQKLSSTTVDSQNQVTYGTDVFYSATFNVMIEGSTDVYEAYLTGISDSGTGSITMSYFGELIEKAIEGGNDYITLTDSQYIIDAEKSYINTSGGDSQLCWAGTMSNLLYYTGWAAESMNCKTNKTYKGSDVSFNNEDDIFDVFMDAFTDNGSNPYYAIPWFFNGVYDMQNSGQSGWADIDSENYSYGNFLGFLPDYYSKDYYDCLLMTASGTTNRSYSSSVSSDTSDSDSDAICQKLNTALEALSNGDGVAMDVSWYNPYNQTDYYYVNGGHSITLWGYVIDPNCECTDMNRYKKLIFADPDNNKTNDGDRTDDLNTVSLVTTKYSSIPVLTEIAPVYGKNMYYYQYLQGINLNGYGTMGIISDFNILYKYCDTYVRDTDSESTHNLFNSPDLYHRSSVISTDSSGENEKYQYTISEAADGIYYYDIMSNQLGTALKISDNVYVQNTITLKKYDSTTGTYTQIGSPKTESTGNLTGTSSELYYIYTLYGLINGDEGIVGKNDLTAGEYEIVIEYNTGRDSSGNRIYPEAYFTNNISTLKFTVLGETYYRASESGDDLQISFSPESSGNYIIASYDENGKMTGYNYFGAANENTGYSFTVTGAGNSTTVKFFKISDNYEPVSLESVNVIEG